MATVKSSNQLLSEFRAFLKAYNPSMDTGDTSLIKDLILTPYSIGTRTLMEQVGISRDLHILSKISGTDLDYEATNYKLERSQGTYSTVTLTFFATIKPTTNITIATGTQARNTGTAFSTPVTFSIISDYTIPVSSIDAYYSYDRARYEFSVSAVCDTIGVVGNLGSGVINTVLGSISGINGVTNLTASIGGAGLESDEDLRRRIATRITGRDLNVVNGLISYINSLGFIDSYPVRVEDSDSERAEGVDVFVVDNTSTSIIETFTYQAGVTRYYLANTPVIGVTSVSSAINGILSSTTDYSISIDNSSPVRRSTDSSDYIEIVNPTAMPIGTTFTVIYIYGEKISVAQNTIETDDNHVLTSNILLKRAFPLSLNLNASLSLTSNADGPATRTRVRNALSQYVSAFRLGDTFQKTDLVVVLQTGYGDFPVTSVDSVVINSYSLIDEFGTTYLPVAESIVITNKQYIVLGSVILV